MQQSAVDVDAYLVNCGKLERGLLKLRLDARCVADAAQNDLNGEPDGGNAVVDSYILDGELLLVKRIV